MSEHEDQQEQPPDLVEGEDERADFPDPGYDDVDEVADNEPLEDEEAEDEDADLVDEDNELASPPDGDEGRTRPDTPEGDEPDDDEDEA